MNGWYGVLRWARVSAVACLLAISGLAAGRGAVGAGTAWASLTEGPWSGYALEGGPYWWVSADFTVPGGICSQGPGETGPGTSYWAGLQGGTVIVQTGFTVSCVQGQPSYSAWHASLIGVPNTIGELVQPGDQVTAEVGCSGSTCLQILEDTTQGWTDVLPVAMPSGFISNIAAVAAESDHGGVTSGPVQVINADVNFAPIGMFNPEAEEQSPSIFGGAAGLDPTPLDPSGLDFDFSWNGNPGS